jgi:hypothetical protein
MTLDPEAGEGLTAVPPSIYGHASLSREASGPFRAFAPPAQVKTGHGHTDRWPAPPLSVRHRHGRTLSDADAAEMVAFMIWAILAAVGARSRRGLH